MIPLPSAVLVAYSRFMDPSASADQRAVIFQSMTFSTAWQSLAQRLPPNEQRVLKLRYSRIAGRAMRLDALARLTGTDVEYLRQLEDQAFALLRRPDLLRRLRKAEHPAERQAS